MKPAVDLGSTFLHRPENLLSPQVLAMAGDTDNKLLELLAANFLVSNVSQFSGNRDESIHEFMKGFEDDTSGLEPKYIVIGIKRAFRGSAKDWLYENCDDEIKANDWQTIRKKIFKRFTGESESLKNRKSLAEARFDPNGKKPLAAFVDTYTALAKRAEIGKISDIINGILVALPEEVLGELGYLGSVNEIKKLDELRSLAARYDDIIDKRRGSYVEKLGAIVTGAQEEMRKIVADFTTVVARQNEQTVAAVKPMAKFTQQTPAIKRKCYNCRELGHISRDCPKQRAAPKLLEDAPTAIKPTGSARGKPSAAELKEHNEKVKKLYEERYGKPEHPCPIDGGFHFVYHCPMKDLKE